MKKQTDAEREEQVKVVFSALKKLQAEFRFPKSVKFYDYTREEHNISYEYFLAMQQLEIITRWRDRNNKRQFMYKYTAGDPTNVMAAEVIERRNMIKDGYLENKKEKAKESGTHQETPKPMTSNEIMESLKQFEVTQPTPELLEQVQRQMRQEENRIDQHRADMIIAAINILGIKIDGEVLQDVVWAVDYVEKEGKNANLLDVVNYKNTKKSILKICGTIENRESYGDQKE